MTSHFPSLRLFLSFAPADVDLLLLLLNHLAPLVESQTFSVWSRRRLSGGEDTERRVAEELERADVVVALVSSDYLASEHRREVERAAELRRHIVPILLRPCAYYEDRVFRRYRMLPHDSAGQAVPVVRSQQSRHDEALRMAADQLKLSVRQLQEILRPEWSARQAIAIDNANGRLGPSYPPVPAPARTGYGAAPQQAYGSYAPVSHSVPGTYPAPRPSAYGAPYPPPTPPALQAPHRVLPWVLAVIALLGAAMLLGALLMAKSEPTSSGSPASPTVSPVVSGPAPPKNIAPAPAPAPTEQGPCCGGVDCRPPEKDVRGTFCEGLKGQCSDCSLAGRRYIGGSCNDRLAAGRTFYLRYSFSTGFVPEEDQVCVRPTGTTTWTCTAKKAADHGRSTRLPIRVADITDGGRGIDIEVRSAGVVIASRSAVRTDSLSTAMLCVGLSFAVGQGRSYFYLDDP